MKQRKYPIKNTPSPNDNVLVTDSQDGNKTKQVSIKKIAEVGGVGPQGPAGPAGANGQNGQDGQDGQDGVGLASITTGFVNANTDSNNYTLLEFDVNYVSASGSVLKGVSLPDTSTQVGYIRPVTVFNSSGNPIVVKAFGGANIYFFGNSGDTQIIMRVNQKIRFSYVRIEEESFVWIAEVINESPNYSEYRARIAQVGAFAPSATTYLNEIGKYVLFSNIINRDIIYLRTNVGQYVARIRTPLGTTTNFVTVETTFADNQARITGTSNGTDGTTYNWLDIAFETRDNDGVLADSRLNTRIFFRMYDYF